MPPSRENTCTDVFVFLVIGSELMFMRKARGSRMTMYKHIHEIVLSCPIANCLYAQNLAWRSLYYACCAMKLNRFIISTGLQSFLLPDEEEEDGFGTFSITAWLALECYFLLENRCWRPTREIYAIAMQNFPLLLPPTKWSTLFFFCSFLSLSPSDSFVYSL